MSHDKGKTMKHEDSESQQVKTGQYVWQPFVVTGQATKTRHPGKTSLNDPTSGQQDEATLGLWQFDHFQTDAMRFRLSRWHIACISLISIRQLYLVPCHFLDGCCQFA